ncbi:CsbD family protein [Nonomuraea zeae]|uniref:CsbD family protein n=1 Tax=Nonomuraea zeae TaxID=1642303 RepID=A0A5S4FZQ9_9ACTN|nr:CsbD family protein [Nonomuraea zeae]TMR25764.1 CsbD family protein [Nonomuraea zeae]
MSVRWEIDNKVQAVKTWVRQRFGRATDNRRPRVVGEPRRGTGNPEQPGGGVKDVPQPPR